MKRLTLVCLLLLLSSIAHGSRLHVLVDYSKAASRPLWKGVKPDQLPEELLAPLAPREFSGKSFVLCHQNCSLVQTELTSWDLVEMATVTHWLEQYFSFIEERFSHRPGIRLKVLTDRELHGEEGEGLITNNAFFNSSDNSLSFLPAENHVLFKLFGKKVNRSGFDPSVIIHEAAHALFSEIYPFTINREMLGLSEGFSDYLANIILGTPKLGLVMLRGKVGRDSSSYLNQEGKAKVYVPNLSPHALGELISLALWKTREASPNREAFDRLVFSAVKELARNPFATVHDFKTLMLNKLSSHIAEDKLSSVERIWEAVLPGSPRGAPVLERLGGIRRRDQVYGLKLTRTHTPEYAQELNLPLTESVDFTLLRVESLTEKTRAILFSVKEEGSSANFWMILDSARVNVLKVITESGEAVELPKLKQLAPVLNQLSTTAPYVQDYLRKLRAFAGLWVKDGELKGSYKVKERKVESRMLEFNGAYLEGVALSMQVKQKFLARHFSDLPELEGITLLSLRLQEIHPGFPEIDGRTVLGYELLLRGGARMKVIAQELFSDL